MLRPLMSNPYNEFHLDVIEQKSRTEKIENNILKVMSKKKDILSVEEYLHGKTDEEKFFFLGSLKYFSKVSRVYIRKNGHIMTYLKAN